MGNAIDHPACSRIGGLQNQITDDQREARCGIASSMAMTPASMPSAAAYQFNHEYIDVPR
jgi:hypothetical protein